MQRKNLKGAVGMSLLLCFWCCWAKIMDLPFRNVSVVLIQKEGDEVVHGDEVVQGCFRGQVAVEG